MTQLIWTRREIEDVQSIRQFIAQDSPHYAELVTQRLIASVERLPALPQSGRVVPEINDPTVREQWNGPATCHPNTTFLHLLPLGRCPTLGPGLGGSRSVIRAP